MGIKCIFWGFVIVWMLVIFNLSSDDRDASSNKSELITAVVQQVASQVPEIELVSSVRYISEHIVRKIGHVLEYFMLTMLVIIASTISRKSKTQIIGNAILIPLLFAVSDELHQFYTPGRGPQVTDVLIDGIGIVAAILSACAVYGMISINRRLQGEKI